MRLSSLIGVWFMNLFLEMPLVAFSAVHLRSLIFFPYNVIAVPLSEYEVAMASWQITSYFLLQMFRFTVHCFRRSKTQPSHWKTSIYTFGHKDLGTCHLWVTRINFSLNMEAGRPKSLLVRWLTIDWYMVYKNSNSYIIIKWNTLVVKEFQI